MRSSKLSLRAPGPGKASIPEAIFILDSRSQTVSVDLLRVSRIYYCISLITRTSKAWVSIASCLHCLPWSLTLDVLHTVIDEAPKTVPSARHSPRHAVSLLKASPLDSYSWGSSVWVTPILKNLFHSSQNTCPHYQKHPPMLFLQKPLRVFPEHPVP